MKLKLYKIIMMLVVLTLCFSQIVASPNTQAIGCLDSVTLEENKIRIRGWAYDPDHKEASLEIQVYSDQGYLGSVASEFVRSDVNSYFSISGAHGYNSTVTASLSGEHSISVYAIDKDTQEKVLISTQKMIFPDEELKEEKNQNVVTDNIDPIGNLEELSINENGNLYYKGWALDQNTTTQNVTIQLYIGDVLYDATTTSLLREDVNKAFSVDGKHGFKKEAEMNIQGTKKVEIYMLDTTSNERVLLGSKEITFSEDSSSDKTDDSKVETGQSDATMPFVDVSKEKWYYDYIVRINQEKLMTGLDATHFGPSDTMNRAMVATVLYRMAGSPEVEYEACFNDVPDGKYYSKPITWCYQNNIANVSNGSFRPRDQVTRQELAFMLRNTALYLGMDPNFSEDLNSFPDHNEVSSWAVEAVSWAVENKLISGDQGKLKPENNATRAQCAKMMLAVYDLIQENHNKVTASGKITNVAINQGEVTIQGTVFCNQENYSIQIYANDQLVAKQEIDSFSRTFNVSFQIDKKLQKVAVYVMYGDSQSQILIDSKESNNAYRYAIDVFTAQSNNLVVSGWIYDENNTNGTNTIVVKADGIEVSRLSASLPRSDVDQAFGITGDHGFNSTIEFQEGTHNIALYALDDLGNEIELASKDLEFSILKQAAVLSGKVDTYIISMNQLSLTGYVTSDQNTELEILIYGDDVLLDTAAANKQENQYLFNDTIQIQNAISKLEVFAKEKDGKELTTIASYVNEHDPSMCLDSITGAAGSMKVQGWAYDPDDLAHSVEIHFYHNGTYLGKAEANGLRNDVNAAFGITGNHGFSTTIETDLQGNQTISIYVVDSLGKEVFYTSKSVSFPTASTISENATKFIAHRGYSSKAPENTARSFILAGENGFWGCETDIYITADEEFICYHNLNFSNLTDTNAIASQLTLNQIKQIRITGGNHISEYANDTLATHIPTLNEYLEICKQYDMVPEIEIKNGPYLGSNLLTISQIQKLYNTVRSIMGDRQVYFIAFDLQNLINLRSYMDQVGDTKTVLQYLTYDPEQVDLDSLQMLNIGLGVEYHKLSQSMIEEVKRRNLKIGVWTVDDYSMAEMMTCFGVDSITSNIQLWS